MSEQTPEGPPHPPEAAPTGAQSGTVEAGPGPGFEMPVAGQHAYGQPSFSAPSAPFDQSRSDGPRQSTREEPARPPAESWRTTQLAGGYASARPGSDLTTWERRVGAWLIDLLPNLIAQTVLFIGYGMWIADAAIQASRGAAPGIDGAGIQVMLIGCVLFLAALAWQLYNRWLTAGRTGQSLGKRLLKMSLLSEDTLGPIGPANAFLRDLVHILDGLAFVGYLWPLWDEKCQTFSDKLMRTVVLDSPRPSRP
ncbi:MAG TPA: RDD family protein [Propionibacteriaceae bacterium]|nr:RDD family protein [Propionibacteriaceae bacterium]